MKLVMSYPSLYMNPVMNTIKTIRTELFRISQVEFAQIAGVTQPTIVRWERGEGEPSASELGRIRAAASERDIDWPDDSIFDNLMADAE